MSEILVESIGGMCPVQGYGTIDNNRFYFRYRHDHAELYVGPDCHEPDEFGFRDPMPDLLNPQLYAEINDVTGDDDRGWLEEDEAVTLLHRLIALLKPPEQWAHGTGMDQLSAQVEFLTKIMREQK